MIDDQDDDEREREARAARILREARDTVERGRRENERQKREAEELPKDDLAHRLIPAPSDPVAQWRAQAEPFERMRRVREAAKEKRLADAATPQQPDWNAL